MNTRIKEMLETETPRTQGLSENEKRLYEVGLMLLDSFVTRDFLDLPRLPEARFSTDGLFYTISYLHDESLYVSGNQRTLLVVWQVENHTSFCPLRIDFKLIDEKNFNIFVYDQSGERTVKKSLISRKGGLYYTDIKNYNFVTLSELVQSKMIVK